MNSIFTYLKNEEIHERSLRTISVSIYYNTSGFAASALRTVASRLLLCIFNKWLHITGAFGAPNSSSVASCAFGAPRTDTSRCNLYKNRLNLKCLCMWSGEGCLIGDGDHGCQFWPQSGSDLPQRRQIKLSRIYFTTFWLAESYSQ